MGAVNGGTDPKSVVLVGVDFSEQSRDIVRAAERVADQGPSELHLVHVMPLLPGDGLGVSRADRQLQYATLIDNGREQLQALSKDLRGAGRHVVGHLRVGLADVEIAQLATDIGADWIVVGTHSRSTWDRLFLGSVAESLVRHAPCPVVTWRPKSVPMWSQIAPPCPDCVAVQRATGRAEFWCERHSQHHVQAHTYYERPSTYGMGSQTFR